MSVSEAGVAVPALEEAEGPCGLQPSNATKFNNASGSYPRSYENHQSHFSSEQPQENFVEKEREREQLTI